MTNTKHFKRVTPKKVNGLIALTAIQRKMLVLIYTLWKNDTKYDKNYGAKFKRFEIQLVKMTLITWKENIFIRLSKKKSFSLKGKLVRVKALTKLDKLGLITNHKFSYG